VLLDLREGGPRPQLTITQPVDLRTGRVRPLVSGDSVRLWSLYEDRVWRIDGSVRSVGIAEGRGIDPVEAAFLRLPYRLLATEQRLYPSEAEPGSLGLSAAPLGPDGPGEAVTLRASWLSPAGEPQHRGGARLLEISRRTATFCVPIGTGPAYLPGSELSLRLSIGESPLRTRMHSQVLALMHLADQVLYGLAIAGPEPGVSEDEHRECLRRAAEIVAKRSASPGR